MASTRVTETLVAAGFGVLGLVAAPSTTSTHPATSDTLPGPQFRRSPGPVTLTRTVIWPHREAILQQLDLRRLLAVAGPAVIVLRVRIGDTLQEGGPVADLHGA